MSEIEWSRDEALVRAEVDAGLARGREVYGRLCLDDDARDFSIETLEEIRDAIVYVSAWLVQARRREKRKARAVGPTQRLASNLDRAVDAVLQRLVDYSNRITPHEIALAARYWADRQLGGE